MVEKVLVGVRLKAAVVEVVEMQSCLPAKYSQQDNKEQASHREMMQPQPRNLAWWYCRQADAHAADKHSGRVLSSQGLILGRRTP